MSELAEEFGPSDQAIRSWSEKADPDDGLRSDGSTTAEREELRRLRKEPRVSSKNETSWQKPRLGSHPAFTSPRPCRLCRRGDGRGRHVQAADCRGDRRQGVHPVHGATCSSERDFSGRRRKRKRLSGVAINGRGPRGAPHARVDRDRCGRRNFEFPPMCGFLVYECGVASPLPSIFERRSLP